MLPEELFHNFPETNTFPVLTTGAIIACQISLCILKISVGYNTKNYKYITLVKGLNLERNNPGGPICSVYFLFNELWLIFPLKTSNALLKRSSMTTAEQQGCI